MARLKFIPEKVQSTITLVFIAIATLHTLIMAALYLYWWLDPVKTFTKILSVGACAIFLVALVLIVSGALTKLTVEESNRKSK